MISEKLEGKLSTLVVREKYYLDPPPPQYHIRENTPLASSRNMITRLYFWSIKPSKSQSFQRPRWWSHAMFYVENTIINHLEGPIFSEVHNQDE